LTQAAHHNGLDLDCKYLRSEVNEGFGVAANRGLALAEGDVLICLNNDVVGRSEEWLPQVEKEVKPSGIYGPSAGMHYVPGSTTDVSLTGIGVWYVEGWCMAAYREVWQALAGFDTERYRFAYYEDADFCFRAQAAGFTLYLTDWPIQHLSNVTSKTVKGAYQYSEQNREAFFERVREYLKPGSKQWKRALMIGGGWERVTHD
jgi:GT2 family glycosyltransferase